MLNGGLRGIVEGGAYVRDAAARGAGHEVGHGEAKRVVVAVGVAHVRGGDGGLSTVADGAGGEGEDERDDKEDGEMERWVEA